MTPDRTLSFDGDVDGPHASIPTAAWKRTFVRVGFVALALIALPGATADEEGPPVDEGTGARISARQTGPAAKAAGMTTAAGATKAAGEADGTLYVVGTAHLDTQWLWTIQDTIREYVPRTLRENFMRFDTHPNYVFSFEGAFRYMLAKEYYPAEYARLREYVKSGRWHVAGSAIDAGDTNIPAPESLIRHVLYANRFFRDEFGKTSADLFLPDCFGFGYALPSVAAHCGLRGFSTQKLTWGSSVGVPFDVGVWEGVDGSGIVAALDAGDYTSRIREDLSLAPAWRERVEKLGRATGVRVGYRYFGVGDTGGAPDDESVAWLERSLTGAGPLRVLSAASDRMYRELTPDQVARLPRYRGELLMTRHGTGCYTSQAAMKRWNRKNEQLARTAEAAAVAADWLGGAPYPRAKLAASWVRFLWHHHHDDVTGTSTPLAYPFSWNDEAVSANGFAAVLADAAGAVARALDTRAEGVPIVVFNPLSFEREDVVEATVRFAGRAPRFVRVFGPDGGDVPSQVLSAGAVGGEVRIAFIGRAPSVGFAVHDVRRADRPCALRTGLAVSEGTLESPRYRVRIDTNGDVSSIQDRRAAREILSAPLRLEMLDDRPDQWPEWEIAHRDVSRPPREVVAGPARVRVVERGPARVAVEVARRAGGSTFTQIVRLVAGGPAGTAAQAVELDTRIDWQTGGTLLKAAFPLAVSNERATYDLGLGTIERGNDRESLYEVPAQQWADLTARDGKYGVAVINDCKYGWDKPSDGVLRLSLVHSPPGIEKDHGWHRLLYALAGHQGDWREGGVQALAARINQPLAAFQATPHAGPLGKRFSMAALDTAQVSVGALKKAEDGDEIVVRLYENFGRPATDVGLKMAAPILSARELTGSEEDTTPPEGTALRLEGGTLRLSLRPYRPRTIALTLAGSERGQRARVSTRSGEGREPLHERARQESGEAQGALLSPPISTPVALPFDADVISLDGAWDDGDFDGRGHSLPGELLPATITSEGIRFELGSSAPGRRNAIVCRGQTIDLSRRDHDRLYILAASAGGDARGVFGLGGRSADLLVQNFTGYVGQSQSLVVDGRIVPAARLEEPFIKNDTIAWIGTHRHDARAGNEPYVFCYLFKYAIDLPRSGAPLRLTLPRNESIRVLAITLARNPNDDTRPASEIIDDVAATRIRPKGGLAIAPVRVTLSSDRPGASIRYTLGGGEPTHSDRLYTAPFTIDANTTVRARAFLGDRALDYVASRAFAFTAPRPPASTSRLVPGLVYTCYEGAWRALAGLAGARPVKTGVTPTFDPSPRTREVEVGIAFAGYIEVPRDGVYTFYTRSDDGSSLSIGDTLVVDNDGLHGSAERSGSVALAAGNHPIRVLFFQRGGDIDLEVSYEGPGIDRRPVPADVLFHESR